MRLGISSWTYPWAIGVPGHTPSHPVGALDLLGRASDLGVQVVQIADNLPLHELADADVQRLRIRADELGLALEIGTVSIGAEHLARYRELAKALGSRFVRVVIDTPTHKPTQAEVVTDLKRSMPDFEGDEVDLLIENHDRFPAVALKAILTEVDSPSLGVCLDTVNSLGSLERVETVFESVAPWVRNVHIKDFVIHRADHNMGFIVEGAPAGEGRVDIARLLQNVSELESAPNVILELWPPAESDLSATLRKERAWAASSIDFLRRHVPT